VADPAEVDAALAKNKAKVVFFTHSETSTGALHDAKAIAQVAKKHGALAVADVVTSLGVHDVRMDAMGIDVAVSGSQKGMMLPPGLAFVALGPAGPRGARGRTPAAALLHGPAQGGRERLDGETPFTPPTALIVGLLEALSMMREEGREQVGAPRRERDATRAGGAGAGLAAVSQVPSNAVTAITSPQGIDAGRSSRRCASATAW
jgi:aspartate aminotransferase-like enzyme